MILGDVSQACYKWCSNNPSGCYHLASWLEPGPVWAPSQWALDGNELIFSWQWFPFNFCLFLGLIEAKKKKKKALVCLAWRENHLESPHGSCLQIRPPGMVRENPLVNGFVMVASQLSSGNWQQMEWLATEKGWPFTHLLMCTCPRRWWSFVWGDSKHVPFSLPSRGAPSSLQGKACRKNVVSPILYLLTQIF